MNEVTREKLASDFKALVSDVEELLKATASQAGGTIAELRQRVEKRLEETKKVMSEREKAFVEKAKEAKATAEAYARENPWAALAIAAGIGLLLGLLLRRD